MVFDLVDVTRTVGVPLYLRQTASVLSRRAGQFASSAAASLVLGAGALRHAVAARGGRHAHAPQAAAELPGHARPVAATRVPALRRLVATVVTVRSPVASPRERDALYGAFLVFLASAPELRGSARVGQRVFEPSHAFVRYI